ncbi:MAG: hypothetical protein GX638_13395 [Crenarchaeota archaeon]|nr:hypothetical protein [Thermoproteota archaeon]
MNTVIKIGGSLSEKPNVLRNLGYELSKIAQKQKILIIPGGAKFADVIRELDNKFKLPASFTHRMAILAMDQYGLFLSQILPNSQLCDSIKEANKISKAGKLAIFLPSKMVLDCDPFEASWDVTSDSIAAYIAIKVHSKKVILITDVDGIFDEDPKILKNAKLLKTISADKLHSYGGRTSVDKFLPTFLLENSIDVYVVNGVDATRIIDILLGKQTICTLIKKVNKK